MNLNELCAYLRKRLAALPGWSDDPECEVLEGADCVQVFTPFLCSDGTGVAVHVSPNAGAFLLTADAAGWGLHAYVEDHLCETFTPHHREVVEGVCRASGVTVTHGDLTLHCRDINGAPEAIAQLASAMSLVTQELEGDKAARRSVEPVG